MKLGLTTVRGLRGSEWDGCWITETAGARGTCGALDSPAFSSRACCEWVCSVSGQAEYIFWSETWAANVRLGFLGEKNLERKQQSSELVDFTYATRPKVAWGGITAGRAPRNAWLHREEKGSDPAVGTSTLWHRIIDGFRLIWGSENIKNLSDTGATMCVVLTLYSNDDCLPN